MDSGAKLFGALAAVAIAIGIGVVFYEINIWQECRETNSRMYCLRIITR